MADVGARWLGETAPHAAALEHARYGLARIWPERSANRRLTPRQLLAAMLVIVAGIAAVLLAPMTLWEGLHAAGFGIFAGCIGLRLLSAGACLAQASSAPRAAWRGAAPTYTLLCPMYQEAGEVPGLLAALARLDYPKDRLDVKLLLEADDVETIAAARAHADPAWVEILIAPACAPRTKPKALNLGLSRARGRFIAVFDAEDRPHPQQVRAALDAFAEGGPETGCVQAPLVIDNGRASWLSAQFAVEYAIQFRGLVPFLVGAGLPPPLGGTSNHFRTEAVRAAGGWDPYNVTEDADIGYRLARDGWRFAAVSPPTWEEAPVTLRAWLRQRSRWIKGHLQTWLVLMRHPRQAARDMGAPAFLAMQVTLGGSILAAFAHAPMLGLLAAGALLERFELPPADLGLALAGWLSALLAAVAAAAAQRDWRLAWAGLSMPFYWPLATLAALLAVVDLVARPHYWAKTEHGVSTRPEPTAA